MVSGFGQVQGDFSLTKQSKVSALGKVVATSAKFGGIIDRLAPFSPLSLNPLLAYEAESSMVAPFEQPTLDLDPSDPDTLDVITATRSGVATYTDADGVIQSASPNTVRVDHVDGVPMILVEPSATNLLRNSQDLTASPNNVANGTITQEYETFKGQPVFRLTDDTSSGEHRLSISAGSVTASRVIVHFFVKADTCTKFCITYPTVGDAAAAWNLQSGSALGSTVGSAVAQTIEDAGDGWFKVSMTYDRPSATATGHNIQTLQDSATSAGDRNYQGDGTLSFLMTMPQLEYGSVATSYIPTNGSTVTRNADQLVIDGSDFTDFFNTGGDGTFYAEFVPRDVLGEQWYLLAGQDLNRRFMYSNVSSAILNAYDGTNTSSSGQDMVANQLNRAAFTYTATTQQSSLDGSNVPAVPHNGNYLTTSRLYLASPANDRQMNGHIKRLIYWPYHSDDL